MILDPRLLTTEPAEITPEQRLIMARGDHILSEANIERQGGTDVVTRSGWYDLYRFGVMIGSKKEAEDAFATAGLGEPFVVFERGRMKAL